MHPSVRRVTLPVGLRREHRTKPGVWGVIRVLLRSVATIPAAASAKQARRTPITAANLTPECT
ncbi:MAG: DUF1971 domain-containing protein [Candidatus Angelobacter sp.]